MGRKKDGFSNAKNKKGKGAAVGQGKAAKKGTAVASETPLAPTVYRCGTCIREFLPGAPYDNHGRKCRRDLAKAAEHAARLLETEAATARLAELRAADVAAVAGGAPVEGEQDDDDDHWSDYEFGGGGDDGYGGGDDF
ncbi:hypothetical protein P7C70_g9538, partial [Phenoliferia sp. Uapishka_3]